MKRTTPRISLLTAAGAIALAAAIPAAAQAATVSWEGETLVVRGAPGERNWISMGAGTLDSSKLELFESGPNSSLTSSSSRCAENAGRYECDVPARLVLDLGDADDSVSLSSLTFDIPVEAYGGDGPDELSAYNNYGLTQPQLLDGGAGDDKVDGDSGPDIVRGGPGNDEVDGGAGNDAVEGGDGDDTVFGDGYDAMGTDTIDGGAGFDKLADWFIPGESVNPPAAVSLDGQANDGRAGENDQVVGVERVEGRVDGTFTGSAGNDDIFVKADFHEGPTAIAGLAGDDKLTGHDYQETIDGGPGDDVIEGGNNHDTLTGGPGKDTIFGDSTADTCNFLSCRLPFGNDVIDARDGEQDTIDCGVGEDRATVDAIDVVANCEQVDKSGKGGGTGGKPARGSLTGPRRYSRKALRKGLPLTLDCAAACTVTFTLTADKATAKRLGTKRIAVGKAKRASAGRLSVRAKLTKPARKRLGRLRKGKATLAALVTDGGATTRYTRKVTLTR